LALSSVAPPFFMQGAPAMLDPQHAQRDRYPVFR
jgi:hypothetical protein